MQVSDSPYADLEVTEWQQKSAELLDNHPLSKQEIVDVVSSSWQSILESSIGKYRIGVDIFPSQQITGFLLQQLISLEIVKRHPKDWRGEKTAHDKDLVNLSNEIFSVEIKTSSHPSGIFGNRSYAQKSSKQKKKKSGYYLTINNQAIQKTPNPEILKIRFGWVDHVDWMGQKAATGQQASLSPDVLNFKLITLFSR